MPRYPNRRGEDRYGRLNVEGRRSAALAALIMAPDGISLQPMIERCRLAGVPESAIKRVLDKRSVDAGT